ncbi:hypothetical protein M5E89_08840 [Acidaminococcus intestini]|nr:hypothetical protein M5E89_08840 [Acidaminococcus intestini]
MAKAAVSLSGRDILDLSSLSVEEYDLIMKTAAEMKKILKRDIKKVPSLRGKSIVNLFYENSTRTRSSFELAGKYLGADVINISTGTSSVKKGSASRIRCSPCSPWPAMPLLCGTPSKVRPSTLPIS